MKIKQMIIIIIMINTNNKTYYRWYYVCSANVSSLCTIVHLCYFIFSFVFARHLLTIMSQCVKLLCYFGKKKFPWEIQVASPRKARSDRVAISGLPTLALVKLSQGFCRDNVIPM